MKKRDEVQSNGNGGILSQVPTVEALVQREEELTAELYRVRQLLECVRAMHLELVADEPLTAAAGQV